MTQSLGQMFPAFKECMDFLEIQPANQDVDSYSCEQRGFPTASGTQEVLLHSSWRKCLEKGWAGESRGRSETEWHSCSHFRQYPSVSPECTIAANAKWVTTQSPVPKLGLGQSAMLGKRR